MLNHRSSLIKPTERTLPLGVREAEEGAKNRSTAALISTTLGYLTMGALVFGHLERPGDEANARKRILRKHNLTDEQLDCLCEHMNRLSELRQGPGGVEAYSAEFSQALYLAFSVITTIGYGHVVPRSVNGKMFTLLYATIGIPLNIVMFQCVGERINKFIATLFHKLRNHLEGSETTSTVPLVVTVGANMVLVVVTLAAGCVLFVYYEKWSPLNALYFCLITLTTIGFGDFVAMEHAHEPDGEAQTAPYTILFALYMFFGLAVISSSMNLVVCCAFTNNAYKAPFSRRKLLQALLAQRSCSCSSVRKPNANVSLRCLADQNNKQLK